ncbi:MAG: recombinase family protein [Rubricoccaceae bacterium]|nr:recombinase family protein [Rubricoccaceae bacterium]
MIRPHENLKPAAIYLRRSTDKQEQSIGDQRKEIERYAAEHGYAIAHEYLDDAISGTSAAGRKQFQQMIADTQNPRCAFQFVLVYDVKRFSRGGADEAGYYRHLLRQSGVEVIYVSEGFTGDESDEILRPVKQYMARRDSIDLSKTTIRGQVTTAKGGWWSGGTPPYGFDLEYVNRSGRSIGRIRYLETGERQLLSADGTPIRVLSKRERYRKTDGDKVKLAPATPERVGIVQLIFQLYAQGLGYTAIADRLNRDGIPSPRNGMYSSKVKAGWAGSTIKAMLENRAYVGDLVWNRRTSAKFHRISKGRHVVRDRRDFEKLQRNMENDYIVKANAHPALVSRELFGRVKAIQQSRQRNNAGGRSGRSARSRYLLSGLVQCGACGHNFVGQPQNRGRRRKDGSPVKTFYYMCGGYLNKGRAVCCAVRIPQSTIESFVLKEIGKRIYRFLDDGGEAIAKDMIRERADSSGRTDAELLAVQRRLDAIQSEISRLLDCITPDTKDEIGRRIRRLKEDRRVQQDRKAQLDRVKQTVVDADAVANDVVARMRVFPEVFEEGTIEEKKDFVRLFVDGIRVDPGKGHVTVQIRRFPAPESLDTGNASFGMVAGAGFEPATFGLCLPLRLSPPR